MFKRFMSEDSSIIAKLKNENILHEQINNDFLSGDVFPAVREDGVHFYHKGSRALTYGKRGFMTHWKYFPILIAKNESNKDLCEFNESDYVNSDDINNTRLKKIDELTYDGIKDAASHYAGVEAIGVSSLYSKYSYLNANADDDIIVLDVEIQLARSKRIDLLLYKKSTQTLLFVEAKDYSNACLWSKENAKPKALLEQLSKYNEEIENILEDGSLIRSYTKYIDNINTIFDLNLPSPESCITECGLYIFGFDDDQKKGRLATKLIDDGSLDGINYYCLGDASGIKIQTLWNALSK